MPPQRTPLRDVRSESTQKKQKEEKLRAFA